MRVICNIATGERIEDHDYVAPSYAPALTQADYSRVLQVQIDQTAAARGYNDGVAAASYLGSTNPAWASEAATFIAWRDSMWVYAYGVLAAVQGGQNPPTLADFVAGAPAITWP